MSLASARSRRNGKPQPGAAAARAGNGEEKSHPRRVRRVTQLKAASARWVNEVSETTAVRAQQVADEGDYWFLTSVRYVNAGVRYTKSAIERFGFSVYESSRSLVPGWMKRRSQRERIRSMLAREAKRAKIELSGEEFEVFSDRIATLLDLVFNGAIGIEEIAFEQDERCGVLDGSDPRAQEHRPDR